MPHDRLTGEAFNELLKKYKVNEKVEVTVTHSLGINYLLHEVVTILGCRDERNRIYSNDGCISIRKLNGKTWWIDIRHIQKKKKYWEK